MLDNLFVLLEFFTTGYGTLLVGLLAGSILAFWNWRTALIFLVVIQVAMSTLLITFHGDRVQPHWLTVQSLVMIICCAVLAISAVQARSTAILRRVDVLWMRVIMLMLMFVAWEMLQVDVPIPLLNPALRRLCVWLAAIAIALLSTRNDPMTVCVALLLWAIPSHALLAVITRSQHVLALWGLAELGLTLACAYLIQVDRNPLLVQTQARPRQPAPAALLPGPESEALLPSSPGSAPLARWQSTRKP